jgi:hypothetical protein
MIRSIPALRLDGSLNSPYPFDHLPGESRQGAEKLLNVRSDPMNLIQLILA